jgi:hypothetical protein
MGATSTGVFDTREECDRWAEQTKKQAERLRLCLTRDFGNQAVMRVALVHTSGVRCVEAISLAPRETLADRLETWLGDMKTLYGWMEDKRQPRKEGYLRCIRFDK